jgi:hypothetical protein
VTSGRPGDLGDTHWRGLNVEAAAARGAARAQRDVAARPCPGAACFGLNHFERDFLSKLEYKCTK